LGAAAGKRTFYARHGFGGSPASVILTPNTGLGAATPQPCPQTIVSLRYPVRACVCVVLRVRACRMMVHPARVALGSRVALGEPMLPAGGWIHPSVISSHEREPHAPAMLTHTHTRTRARTRSACLSATTTCPRPSSRRSAERATPRSGSRRCTPRRRTARRCARCVGSYFRLLSVFGYLRGRLCQVTETNRK
jgi:hypothetical protein